MAEIKGINLRGKTHVLFKELLELAHERDLEYISTRILLYPNDDNNHIAVVKATVKLGDKTFDAHGDASQASVNSMIGPHIIRMAETRAVGRAFRFALNIGLVMKEELGSDNKKTADRQGMVERCHSLETELAELGVDMTDIVAKMLRETKTNDYTKLSNESLVDWGKILRSWRDELAKEKAV